MAIAFSRVTGFGRCNAGSTAVEFAIVAPILFVLMFAIMEFGRAWWTNNSLQYAVEQASRYAVIANAGTAAVQTYAASKVSWQMINSSTFNVVPGANGAICVTYSFPYVPLFGGELAVMSGTTLTGMSCRTPYPAS
jgi:Flp pilus assembly protein TadG